MIYPVSCRRRWWLALHVTMFTTAACLFYIAWVSNVASRASALTYPVGASTRSELNDLFDYPLPDHPQMYDHPLVDGYYTGFAMNQTLNLHPSQPLGSGSDRRDYRWSESVCCSSGSWISSYTHRHLVSDQDLRDEVTDLIQLAESNGGTVDTGPGALSDATLKQVSKIAPAWASTPSEHHTVESYVSSFAFEWVANVSRADDSCISSSCPSAPFDSGKFLHRLQNKRLALLGDSMMRQFFEQLSVELEQHEIGRLDYLVHGQQGLPDIYISQRFYPHNTTVTFAHLYRVFNEIPLAKLVPAVIWRSDVLLFNVGAHYNRFRDVDESRDIARMLEHTEAFASFLHQRYGGLAVFREYSPFHPGYSTHPDWEWDPEYAIHSKSTEWRCASLDETHARDLVQWRHQNNRVNAMNDLMAKYDIPVMRVFNLSASRPDAHVSWSKQPYSDDCRHWMSKSSVLRTWVRVFGEGLLRSEI